MKKILLLLSGISQTGGIEKYTQNFLEAALLADNHFSGNVIVMNDKEPPNIPGIERMKFFCCGSKYRFLRKIKFVLFFIYIIIIRRPSFILSNHIGLLRLYCFMRPFLRINYGLMVYGVDVYNLSLICKKIFENSKFVTSISSYTSSKLLEQVDVKEKIRLIPPLVDGSEFFPKQREERLLRKYKLKGQKVLLTVCRLSSIEGGKGNDKVIESLPIITKHFPDIKYLIAGEGDDSQRLKDIVSKYGVEDNVVFCGFVSQQELIDYYNMCDLYIMPSIQEGFGIVFIEALACGKPVIAGNRDGSVDALLNGKIGTLVDPHNVEAIARSVIDLLKGNGNGDTLNKGLLREQVLKTYGKEQFNNRVKALLLELS
ncbi:MAG: glycosyltransferase [Candidatus Omnitrophota bacterium]